MASIINTPYERAFSGEIVFGSSNKYKYMLGSNGYRSCIAFSGWNPETTVGFLAHFVVPEQVDEFYYRAVPYIIDSIPKDSFVPPFTFECCLLGGSNKTNASAEIINKIKNGFNLDKNVCFKLVKEEVPTEKFVLKSLSLNTKNGKFGEYDPQLDSNPRKLTKIEIDRASDISEFNKLIFANEL